MKEPIPLRAVAPLSVTEQLRQQQKIQRDLGIQASKDFAALLRAAADAATALLELGDAVPVGVRAIAKEAERTADSQANTLGAIIGRLELP
jgi:hypothetical protein